MNPYYTHHLAMEVIERGDANDTTQGNIGYHEN
jgi:hypothetical protein